MENFQLIDSHCHLNYDFAPKSTDDLVREANDQGVSTLITIGVDVASLPVVRSISEKFKNVYHTVGYHPHDAITLRYEDLATLEQAAQHPKCLAIGEIGLDYHYDHSPREIQKKWLHLQLEVALKARLPVVVHSREGEDDLLSALHQYAQRVPTGEPPGVIHCFTGTREFGLACLDLGFYISFSGILTFKTAEDIRRCASEFPLNRLLVETDSPYLAPIPHRGKKCEPSMVRHTAMKLAEIKGLSLDEITQATTQNSRRLFKIP